MILNQGWFNEESNCVSAGFIKFVVLHSFVIMIFAFANNVQVVLYLYSRRLERKKYLGSDISLCQRVQPHKIPWDGWKLGASVPRCKQTITSAPWIPPVQIWMILVLLVYSKGSILVESLSNYILQLIENNRSFVLNVSWRVRLACIAIQYHTYCCLKTKKKKKNINYVGHKR